MTQMHLGFGALRTRPPKGGRTIPTCHPDRKHAARGLCQPCWCKYRRSPEFKTQPLAARMATCHTDKKHYALDLCMACYEKLKYHTESQEARVKRKHRATNYQKQYQTPYKRERENYRESSRKWATTKGREYFRNRHLLRRELMAGRPCPPNCECCGAASKLVFDHCHNSGAFRGWICQQCNKALGCVRDNPTTLRHLIEYLDKQQVMRDPLADQQNPPADDRRPTWPTLH